MRVKLRMSERGDTLVEVLLATVVLSIVLAGSFSLSTRALRLNQTATERTDVVNKMREQTEMLQLIHNNRETYSEIWNAIQARVTNNENFYFQLFSTPGDPASALNNPLAFNTIGLADNFVPEYQPNAANEISTGVYRDSYGGADIYNIRIEPRGSAEYVDFEVRANWEGIGGLGEQQGASVLRLPL